jgi:glutathione reductase (NADPH)
MLLLVTLMFSVSIPHVFSLLHPLSSRVFTRNTKIMRMMMSDKSKHYDYLVIGGGSGGVASARRAAGYGAKVGIVEVKALGGTCVNVGCVPKKVMWNAATVNEVIADAKHFGYDVPAYTFNWKYLKDVRDAYITRLNGIYAKMLAGNKVSSVT